MVHHSARPRRQLEAAVFRPPRGTGVVSGAVLAAASFAFAGLALQAAAGAPAEFKTFVAWVLAGGLAVTGLAFVNWTYGIGTLSYVIERDALNIRWGFRRVVIPIDTVLRLVPGRTVDAPRVKGLNWPGCHIGHADVPRIGYTLFYSTHRAPGELLFIHTTQESYAVSVLDQAAFAEEVQARAVLAPIEAHPQRSSATGLAALPFWRDRVAISAVALSVVACVALCGFVFFRYPDLPDVVRLNFPVLGGLVRIGDKSELLKLAYAGLAILGVNLVAGVAAHSKERAAGLWLLASGGMLQLVLLGAAIAAFGRA